MFDVTRPQNAPLRVMATFFLAFLGSSWAQSSLVCNVAATNLIDRAEGLAEPSGDIVFSCNGTPGSAINANITASYNVPVTNRLVNGAPDAVVTVDTGAGPAPVNVTPVLLNANVLAFNGVSLTVPPTGLVIIRIINVRLATNIAGAGRQISANLSTTALSLSTPSVLIAAPATGLLATYASTGITCTGSLLPSTITFANLIATGTNFASTRLTEGFSNAFTVKDATSDAGTRFLIRYSNFPAGARVFIPDYVTGSDSPSPTAAGDIGGTVSAGAYAPGTLLLARVLNADATGAGGAPIGTPSMFTAGSITEVPLTGGVGTAVYEVIDANNSVQENAQFPTFIGLPPVQNQTPVVTTEAVSFGPFNTVSTAAAGLPVPRFAAPPPPSDCQAVGDCGANYFPKLSATSTGLQFSISQAGNLLTQFIQVNNISGGTLEFSATVIYQGTGGWLTITNESGNPNHTTLRLDAQPIGLAQGVYNATVTINAGAAGTQSFPATFTIGAGQVAISSVVNAASFQPGPLVAGSLATIKGTNLSGKVVTVTFNGLAGTVLFGNATQINVQVPASLASSTSAQVVVTVDGNSSTAVTVPLAAVSPGIFGVLNQDSSLNTPSNPAAGGTVIQIFVTGLISPVSSGPVVVGLDNQGIPTLYSGGAPNGVQQVNAQLPLQTQASPGSQHQLTVCGTDATGKLICSPIAPVYLK
jgi:uncharacterized protein (TIGR03437 family)